MSLEKNFAMKKTTSKILIGLVLAPVAILLLVAMVLGCAHVPRSLPPQLARWAAQKAEILAACRRAGHEGRDLVQCLGDYAEDRGTYACERAERALEGEQ